MRKVIVGLCAFLTLSLCTTVLADGTNSSSDINEIKTEQAISVIYNQIDFGNFGRISYDVFDKAYRGYLNLRSAGKLSLDKQVISICDFSLPSVSKRLWIIDLCTRKVIFNTWVAHGQGSGDDGHLTFSNEGSTHKSSLGFYVTGETYDGEHGTSLRLDGMDEGYNDNAYDRGIVVHGAGYVGENYISNRDRLGRSWGCPAVPAELSLPIIDEIKDRTCLFIYYPEHRYLKNAYWLNKKIDNIPGDLYGQPPMAQSMPHTRIIQYIHNGKVDSVKTEPVLVHQ
jgi:L,D-transpeptidase catalytic domain